MMQILYEPFPNSVSASGQEYLILTDFREWLRFLDMMTDAALSEEERASLCALWLTPQPQTITPEIVDALLTFLRADALEQTQESSEEEEEESEDTPELPKPPVMDFKVDARYILGDFRRFYGIDLLRIEYLHWWEFLSLLRALPDESMTMRRIGYRSTDLNEIPDKRQRARIAKIQRQIALPFAFDDEMIGAMMWNA